MVHDLHYFHERDAYSDDTMDLSALSSRLIPLER